MRVFLAFLLIAMALESGVASAESLAKNDVMNCSELNEEKSYKKGDKSSMFLIPGKEGWVFRSKGDLATKFQMTDSAREALINFKKALSMQGVELIIALIPTRGMISEGLLPMDNLHAQGYDRVEAIKNYTDYIASINGLGIDMVGTPDLKSGRGYFYKTDHHWTTAGAKEMAEAVSLHIKNMNNFRKIKKMNFKTVSAQPGSFEGSFNSSLKNICGFKLPLEVDETSITTKVAAAGSEADLFGETDEPDVVLIGTSNSKRNDFNPNFEGFLKQFLSADVYNAAISGAGFDDPFISYLNSDRYKNHKPKIIVWEVPSYYSTQNEEMEKFLRQAIPSIYGECKRPIAKSGLVKLTADKVVFFADVGKKRIQPEKTYVRLMFDSPIKKRFSVAFNEENGESEDFEFKRSKYYPYDGRFYYAPKGKSDFPLSSVTLKVPPEMNGLSVDAQLCQRPVKEFKMPTKKANEEKKK